MSWQLFVANFPLRAPWLADKQSAAFCKLSCFSVFSTPCLIIYKFSIFACLLASLSPDFIRTPWNVLEESRVSAAPQNTVPDKVIFSTLKRYLLTFLLPPHSFFIVLLLYNVKAIDLCKSELHKQIWCVYLQIIEFSESAGGPCIFYIGKTIGSSLRLRLSVFK